MTTDVKNPFVGAEVGGSLYGSADRLARRTGALHRAKTAGRPVADVIAELATACRRSAGCRVVLDLGCGRGSSTQRLAATVRPDLVIGLDASAALLAEARRRMPGAADGPIVLWTQGDFHHLPVRTSSCDLVVAAFCLYHSAHPEHVVAEIARCLVRGGIAVLVTKSADSYHQLDTLVATAGLDRGARARPSLYSSAHSGNLAALAATALRVCRVQHEQHRFTFTGLRHVAEYLATSPKYQMPPALLGQPDALEAALLAAVPDQPLHTDSTVTYVLAHHPAAP